jgi:hypothetical protein
VKVYQQVKKQVSRREEKRRRLSGERGGSEDKRHYINLPRMVISRYASMLL